MKNLIIVLFLISFSQSFFSQQSGESYKSFTFDGAWCWFTDPRAVYFEGKHQRTYAGWVDSYGDIIIGCYDHQSKNISTKVLSNNFEKDDHDNPALLITDEGKIMVFFTGHFTKPEITFFESKHPENILEWNEPKLLKLNDTLNYKQQSVYTYCNPYYLSKEKKIYLFWRGIDGKPFYSTSADKGKTWTTGKMVFTPEPIYNFRRPYLKIESNGKDKIFFAFTDGHPRDENENSIYFAFYKDGSFFKANGEKIADISASPFNLKKSDVVYDAAVSKQKAWIWDIAYDENENPVITYVKFPDDSLHICCYAKWDGKKWINNVLINSGKWFPQTKQGTVEREPNYSGGIVLDHEDPSVAYLSVNRDSVFEIEKWTTKDNGNSWNVEAVTKNSSKDNVRPFAVRNAKENNPFQVLWLSNTKYIHYTDYQNAVKMNILSPAMETPFDSVSIVNIIQRAADWQLENPRRDSKIDWHYGAFYTGIMALYKLTKDERYLNEMLNIGESHNWRLHNDIFHADRHTISQVFIELYEMFDDPKMIENTRWVLDAHLRRYPKADIRYANNPYVFEWWTWCDALYMSPPAFARMAKVTGDVRYLEYMDKHWWITSDYLYSNEDSLYFRDDNYFEAKTSNGKKTFWARGNGWVIAGIARVLNYMPEDYPSRRKFEQQFVEMAEKLLKIQREHGLWTVSLYDPEELPIGESSGSSFYTFALAWGVNNGLLDKEKFEPAIKKAWATLCKNVNNEGRLGYVQQVAGSPYPFYDYQSHVYATGAFLQAGAEMIKLIKE
jgi:rhamnogalacturonyl hydrolase YesR